MLVDVELVVRPEVGGILAIIADGPPEATRLDVGLYQVGHFNFDHVVREKIDPYWQEVLEFADVFATEDVEGGETLLGMSEFGVCDSVEQFTKKYGDALKSSSRKFCVSFTKICRDDQPEDGGWRWCKWGPYVGDQTPEAEYIHDEPKIEAVFVYHVYEIVPLDVLL